MPRYCIFITDTSNILHGFHYYSLIVFSKNVNVSQKCKKNVVSADAWKLFKLCLLCQDTNLNSGYKKKKKKKYETFFKSLKPLLKATTDKKCCSKIKQGEIHRVVIAPGFIVVLPHCNGGLLVSFWNSSDVGRSWLYGWRDWGHQKKGEISKLKETIRTSYF